jgi:hypothetical protein
VAPWGWCCSPAIPTSNRELAVKVMAAPHLASDDGEQEELRQRFLQEASAAGRLNHPGIVMVHDSATDPATGWPYIAMELVVGRSLEQVLHERGPLPVGEAVDIAIQVAEALAYAHERGVVHRDVKPGNILIGDDGRVKVTDFGIAKVASQSLTLTGHVMGSPFYMSPEQIRGDVVDGRSDLFSLGAMLYKSVTGNLPFSGDSIATVAFKVVNIDHRPADESVMLPGALVAVIDRCLAKDPAERFDDGAQLAAALATVRAELVGRVPEGASIARPARAPQGKPVAGPPAPSAGDRGLDGTLEVPATTAVARGRPPSEAHAGTTRPRWPLVLAGTAAVIVAALVVLDGGTEVSQPTPGASPAVGPRIAATPLAPAPTPAPTPTPIPTAHLQLRFRNHLASGTLAVWVDGERVWLHQVEEVRNPLRRAAGQELRHTLEVTAGEHTVEVRVSGRAAGRRIDTARRIAGTLTAESSRSLRVVLNPLTRNLELEWGG